jgi:hypothetical protein
MTFSQVPSGISKFSFATLGNACSFLSPALEANTRQTRAHTLGTRATEGNFLTKLLTQRLIIRDPLMSDVGGWHSLMSDSKAMFFLRAYP